MELTREQLSDLGKAFHSGQAVGCPNCNAELFAESCPMIGKASFDVYFCCPRCGVEGRFEPVDSKDPWVDSERSRIVDDYLRSGSGLCPRDRAKLGFIRVSFTVVHAMCPYCGRNFTSAERLETAGTD